MLNAIEDTDMVDPRTVRIFVTDGKESCAITVYVELIARIEDSLNELGYKRVIDIPRTGLDGRSELYFEKG
jgi:ethanolamine ammonia-lyase small subunit